MSRPEPVTDHLFVVGAQRCGTTYLYRLLDSHPEITMAQPVRPEPKVFLTDDYTGDPEAYDRRMFVGRLPTRVRGEKGTSYLEHPAALDRIAGTFPDAHIVVMLRDPIERALSNYRFTADHGLEERAPDEALVADLEGRTPPHDPSRTSVSPYAYVRRGLYLDHLREVERRFRHDRVHVIVYEELVADDAVLAGLFRALGVDDTHRSPDAGLVVNASQVSAELSPPVRTRLREFYRQPNAALARHLGRPLDAWQ